MDFAEPSFLSGFYIPNNWQTKHNIHIKQSSQQSICNEETTDLPSCTIGVVVSFLMFLETPRSPLPENICTPGIRFSLHKNHWYLLAQGSKQFSDLICCMFYLLIQGVSFDVVIGVTGIQPSGIQGTWSKQCRKIIQSNYFSG